MPIPDIDLYKDFMAFVGACRFQSELETWLSGKVWADVAPLIKSAAKEHNTTPEKLIADDLPKIATMEAFLTLL